LRRSGRRRDRDLRRDRSHLSRKRLCDRSTYGDGRPRGAGAAGEGPCNAGDRAFDRPPGQISRRNRSGHRPARRAAAAARAGVGEKGKSRANEEGCRYREAFHSGSCAGGARGRGGVTMALFGVSFPRREVTIRGEGIYLRPCQMRDYAEWAALREKSRAFLTPWEPVWPHDDLTRMAFRFRVKRHAEEAARDEAYSYFIFREEDEALVGGLSLGHVRRGVSQAATLGYWMGQPYAGQGIMTRAVRATIAYAFEFQGL